MSLDALTVRAGLTGAILAVATTALAVATASVQVQPPPEPRVYCVLEAAPIPPPTPSVDPMVIETAPDFGPACNVYLAEIYRMADCEGLSLDSRNALIEAAHAAKQAWKSLPPETQPTLQDACRQGYAALVQAGQQICTVTASQR